MNVEIHRRSVSNTLTHSSGADVHAWASHAPTGDATSPFRSFGKLHVSGASGYHTVVEDSLAVPLVDPESPPQLAEGPDGALYLAWSASDTPESVWRSTGILVARSDDGGDSWMTATRPGGAFGGYQNNHELHVAEDGTVWVAWLDSRGDVDDDGAIHVYVAHSKDRGQTWSTPSQVDPAASCECCRVSITADGDGNVYVGWRKILEGGIRDIVVARSDDEGASWSDPVVVFNDGWVQGYCPDAGPTMAFDSNGRMHVAWWTGKEGAAGVKSTYSDNKGASFARPTVHSVAQASRASHVQLTSGENGTMAIVWDDGSLETPRVAVVATTNGGHSWSTPTHVGPENSAAAYPHASFTPDGELSVFWNQRGTADAPSRLVETGTSVWVEADLTSTSPNLLLKRLTIE